jgi:Anti-sigma factor NepR
MTPSNANTVETETPSEAVLDKKVLEAIGRALKAHYDDLLHAPLPEKFLELLDRLEAAEARENGDASR